MRITWHVEHATAAQASAPSHRVCLHRTAPLCPAQLTIAPHRTLPDGTDACAPPPPVNAAPGAAALTAPIPGIPCRPARGPETPPSTTHTFLSGPGGIGTRGRLRRTRGLAGALELDAVAVCKVEAVVPHRPGYLRAHAVLVHVGDVDAATTKASEESTPPRRQRQLPHIIGGVRHSEPSGGAAGGVTYMSSGLISPRGVPWLWPCPPPPSPCPCLHATAHALRRDSVSALRSGGGSGGAQGADAIGDRPVPCNSRASASCRAAPTRRQAPLLRSGTNQARGCRYPPPVRLSQRVPCGSVVGLAEPPSRAREPLSRACRASRHGSGATE